MFMVYVVLLFLIQCYLLSSSFAEVAGFFKADRVPALNLGGGSSTSFTSLSSSLSEQVSQSSENPRSAYKSGN